MSCSHAFQGQCSKKNYVPQPDHIPEDLQGLTKQVVKALRPLDIDAGVYQRANFGYRVHTSMMTFSWAEESVLDKIKALKKHSDREKARGAYLFLMEDSDTSWYKSFADRHDKFLRKNPAATEKQRKRPLRFIEERGIECALWPNLYWDEKLCETVVRLTDSRRKAARKAAATDSESESSSDSSRNSEDSSDDETLAKEPRLPAGRHSIRKSFMTKILSPVIGYNEDYELLHFVYDLLMWSNLGGAKNATQGKVPLRLALKGSSFTPGYWMVRHKGVIDMQRQCGHPAIFRTRAPYEKSFPYHIFVLDEMAKAGKGRQNLAGLETYHMAHVMKELTRGYLTGSNKKTTDRPDRQWRNHLFGPADPQDDYETVANYFARIEFQDSRDFSVAAQPLLPQRLMSWFCIIICIYIYICICVYHVNCPALLHDRMERESDVRKSTMAGAQRTSMLSNIFGNQSAFV